MADRPILFSAPMIRALLDGRKTQTRRILKPQPQPDMGLIGLYAPGLTAVFGYETPDADFKVRLRFIPGDRLWVRESWKATGLVAFKKPSETRICGRFAYMADPEQLPRDQMIPWRPSIHMPRWASRLTLTVTDVRVERLTSISEADARDEGIEPSPAMPGWWQSQTEGKSCPTAWDAYGDLWNAINGEGAWQADPWVVAYTFTVENGNIDRIGRTA